MNTKAPHGQDEFFTEGLSEWDPTLDRRAFLKLSSAAIALAGLSACVKPPLEKIFSYVSQPEDLVPGEPEFFATHYCLGGYAHGLLVETHEGRPTRIDGNPGHPATKGSASAIHQALALSLYHPDRIQTVLYRSHQANEAEFWTKFKTKLSALEKKQGEGLAILSEGTTSETISVLQEKLIHHYPKMKWVEYSPARSVSSAIASQKTFGQNLTPIYDFKAADLIVSFGADFLHDPHYPLAYAQAFADRDAQAKLFVIESSASLIGTKANSRLALKPSEIDSFGYALATSLLKKQALSSTKIALSPLEKTFFDQLLAALRNTKGPVIFLAAETASVEMHAICNLLNEKFAQSSVHFIKSPLTHDNAQNLNELTDQLNQDKIDTLVILGSNPVYASSQGLKFKAALKKLQFSLQLAVDENETAECVDWVIPEKHALETWSDAKAYDGTLSFSQPLISPMYSGISQSELLHFILTGEKKTDRLLLNEIYQKKWGLAFESRMQEALRQGLVSNSQSDLVKVQSRAPLENFAPKNSPPKDSFEILFQTDRKLYDGRFANHPWLQELPGALSRLAWGNALHLNPKDLDQRNLKSGDVVELKSDGKKISIPVFSDPLQSLSSGTLSFGYGRTRAGNVGSGIGHDVYPLWNGQDFLSNVTVTQTSEFEKLANVQEHHSMEGRDIVRTVKKGEKAAKFESPVSLYSENPIPENEIAWAMSIDLDRCTGCGACVIACQSENNIPTVGKEGVLVGREMHWIRVDRYFETEEATTVHFQPVPCMHCEKAPCEPVCPTGATVHGNGGLNQMVYNRCVGTRYCSNNCPYKVRRFNFLTYNDKNSKLAARQKNPDVTVRTRGVMEKCTYCVQRISAARIKSARDRTPLIDGSVKTACQTTCPSHAIVFGNLMDETSEVSKLRKSYRNYGLLEELGTRPRTTYLAKVSKEGQS